MNVYQAISAVQKDLSAQGISKDRKNTQGSGYAFRGIDDVYNALAPALARHGLCILPRVLNRESVESQSKASGALFYITVEVEFDLVAEDGSKHTIKTYGEAMDSGDKATNKAMSAAYKYACMQSFCIATEGDNDADSQTHQVAPKVSKTKGIELDHTIALMASAVSYENLKDIFRGAWVECHKDQQFQLKNEYDKLKANWEAV
jgi:hypothetical protein